jgi:ATP-dependent Clp protease ATP-binding subunit ClpA
MNPFYDRFTDRARKVMQLARDEAHRFNHEYIGTEHMLLGLVRDGQSVAANVLKNMGVELKRIREEVEKLVQHGSERVAKGTLSLTPRAKRVLELSLEESRNLGHNYIGTEHLLLGVLREYEGVAAHVLMNLGVKLEAAKDEVLNVLNKGPREKAPEGRVAADASVMRVVMKEAREKKPPESTTAASYELRIEDTFAAAHRLREYQGECERLHGHNWRIEVVLAGAELNRLGMLMDFRDEIGRASCRERV